MNDIEATDKRLKILIGGLQALSTIEDSEALQYLSSEVGLQSFIQSAAGFRTPHLLVVDGRQIHASGPKIIDELFDDLVLENKLPAANELRSRLVQLYVNLRSIDHICLTRIGDRDIDSERDTLDAILEPQNVQSIHDAKQDALEICLFAMKIRKALLIPPLDPIESDLNGNLFRMYQILKHRKTVWSEYSELANEFKVQIDSIKKYLRDLETQIMTKNLTINRPRGENKCRLESISDESIRE